MAEAVTKANKAEAEQLKALGNLRYSEGKYDEAYKLYSEAIEKDQNNAIYYANRAAARMAKKEYTDAVWDCIKATKIDPTYANAYARGAKVLFLMNAWDESIDAYQKALDALPKDNLTGAQKILQQECVKGLANARSKRREKLHTKMISVKPADLHSGKMPWARAQALEEEKRKEGEPSSVFVINYAMQDLRVGHGVLKQSTFSPKTGWSGKPDVVVWLSNSILTDERVFRLDCTVDSVSLACIAEDQYRKGWTFSGGPAIVKKEVKERFAAGETWQTIRPAIAVTVRIWIIMGFLNHNVTGRTQMTYELYANALDVLEWGRMEWPDVPRSERGAIFEISFVNGVKRLYLDAMREEHCIKGVRESRFTYADIMTLAEEVIRDVNEDIMGPINQIAAYQNRLTPHFMAYWMQPRATAFASLGWCFIEAAKYMTDEAEKTASNAFGAQCYTQAFQCVPKDDEIHILYIRKALEGLFAAKAPLKDTLIACKLITFVGPETLDIWGGYPTIGERLRAILKEVATFETTYSQLIAEGKMTEDDFAELPPLRWVPVHTKEEEVPVKMNDMKRRRERLKTCMSKVV